jgi:hypothetical protein
VLICREKHAQGTLKGGIMLKESSVNERLCAIYGQIMYVIPL